MSAPLCPAHCNVSHLPKMMLDVAYLRDGAINEGADDATYRARMNLMVACFHQVPAGSLPDDDWHLSRIAGFGGNPKKWTKLRSAALAEWVRCDDGRLYHPRVVEAALEAYIRYLNLRLAGKRGNEVKWGQTAPADDVEQFLIEANDALRALNPHATALARQRSKQPGPANDRGAIATGSQENKNEPKENENQKRSEARGAHLISDEWEPTDEHRRIAAKRHITAAQLKRSTERYRANVKKKGRRPSNEGFKEWLEEERPDTSFGPVDAGFC